MNYLDLKIYSEQPIGPFWFKKRAFKKWFRLVKSEEVTKARRMLKEGINVNLKDRQGKTAFDYALKNNDLMMMILLIKFGVSIELSTEEKIIDFFKKISDLNYLSREKLIKMMPNESAQNYLKDYHFSSRQ